MKATTKNWYENYANLHRIFELENPNDELKAFPKTWQELKKWLECIDENITTVELTALINRINIDDLVCKNNAREFLIKKINFPKKEFDKIWKKIKNPKSGNIEVPSIKGTAIRFNRGEIIITNKQIHLSILKKDENGKEYASSEELILDGSIKFDKKTFDYKTNNSELFSFWFNDYYYPTMPMSRILDTLRPYTYKGNNGMDIIKRYFNVESKDMLTVKAEYVLGFNNGWKLPQLEGEKGYAIIVYTDYQKDAYNKAKTIIKEYSEKKKTEIIEKFTKLIEITQNRENLVILLAWSLSAPFRLPILEYCDIFPHLFNIGNRLSGKNTLESTFITDFYKIYDKMLSPNVLESDSRLEDHLTESTFPHVITEIHKVKNINVLPLLKDHATGTSDFERKKNAFELAVRKPKVAGLSFDSNNPLDFLKDSAMNTKVIVNNFKKQVTVDPIWKNLNRELKKEKLFSFIYDYTKNWTNKDVHSLLERQLDKIENEFGLEKVQRLERENPRLISIYQILMFGLELLKNVFGIEIDEGIETILNPIKIGRQLVSMELKDKLFAFCKKAKDFDEGYLDINGYFRKGDNPKHLQFPLKLDKNERNYCFTQDNLRDFNEYSKKAYYLKELNDLIADALEDKENIQLVNKHFNGNRTRYIQIKKDLFENKKKEVKK